MSTTRPAAALGGASSSNAFSQAFQQIQSDVNNYIIKGDGGFVGDTPASQPAQAMSMQAMALRGGAIDGTTDSGVPSDVQQQFLASIKPWAQEAADKLGVSPDIVAAHAALESGWGQRPLRNGTANSNNLFGIKAGGNWQGEVAAASTTEYEHGAMLKKTERFRSYPDTASAFRDYAAMLSGNPRFQAALNSGSDAHAFASGLAQGGYATDPAYADKLSKLASQLQRTGATGSGNPR